MSVEIDFLLEDRPCRAQAHAAAISTSPTIRIFRAPLPCSVAHFLTSSSQVIVTGLTRPSDFQRPQQMRSWQVCNCNIIWGHWDSPGAWGSSPLTIDQLQTSFRPAFLRKWPSRATIKLCNDRFTTTSQWEGQKFAFSCLSQSLKSHPARLQSYIVLPFS